MDSSNAASDVKIARAQFLKMKRKNVRDMASLAADAEIARMLPVWEAEFDERSLDQQPEVFDVTRLARRLLNGGD